MIEETNVDSEIDTENDEELEANDTNDDEGTDNEEVEEESESEEETGGDFDDDDSDARDRAANQINRLKKEKAEIKEKYQALLKEKGREGGKEIASNSELVERTYLAANGIRDKDVQNEVIRLAHKFDMSVDEALDDADIKGRAETLIKKKEAARSVAKTTGGAAKRTKDVSYYVSYFKKNGDFPADASSAMIAKAADILAGD